MLPSIKVSCGSVCFILGNRCTGCLTGSRSAGQLARVPVGDAFLCLQDKLVDTFIPSVGLCSWIDNIYSLAKSPTAAINMIQDVEDILRDRWNLFIKTGSKEVLACHRCPENFAAPDRWSRVDQMQVLGDIITGNMDTYPLLHAAENRAWASFWANSGSLRAKHLPVAVKMQLLQR